MKGCELATNRAAGQIHRVFTLEGRSFTMWIFRFGMEEVASGLFFSCGKRRLVAGVWPLRPAYPLSRSSHPKRVPLPPKTPDRDRRYRLAHRRAECGEHESRYRSCQSESIATTGKTDISDLIMQLPQNLNNSLGQDLGNTSSGLTTAGGIATADLRGLGPNRTLVLVDGRRLGQGSPYTFIQSPAPDLDQIPAGLVDRIEVVTGGASAAYGSDAIAGVINFIMKKNFQGMQFDGQYNENYHNNHDTYMQNLVRGFR